MSTYQRILCVLLLACAWVNIFAQHSSACGTTMLEQYTTPAFVNQQPEIVLNNVVVSEVPIQFHIIGSNTGALAVDSAVIFEELELVNEAFAPIEIMFVHCGNINYINNNDYLTFVKGEDEDLCDIHDRPNVLNIYYALNLENGNEESLCGYAYNFDIQSRVFMDNGCAGNGSTLTHELGHSFSLLHTHSTSNGEELSDGSNCDNAGDLLCDTPADPRLSNDNVDSACNYNGSETDAQGNTYAPATDNLMSYSRKECRDYFSPQQRLQMASYYQLEGGFLNCDSGPVGTTNASVADLDIYPNPTRGTLSIKGVDANSTIDLININGQLCLRVTVDIAANRLEMPSLNNLPAGVYSLRVQASDGSIRSSRIVKE